METIQNKILLRAVHLAGHLNSIADHLSGVKDSTHKLVSEQSGFESDFQYLGKTNGRSFCMEMESQGSNLLFLDSRSECTSSRCVVNYMEQQDSLCISSNMSNSKTSHAHEKVSSVK